jgi:hypothetical protein
MCSSYLALLRVECCNRLKALAVWTALSRLEYETELTMRKPLRLVLLLEVHSWSVAPIDCFQLRCAPHGF